MFSRKSKLLILSFLCLFIISSGLLLAQTRKEIDIPDIPGFITLKCDFHMHTVFSDGSVWPSVRPSEAWREGLDSISITDHIEYQPHKADVPTSHNRPFEIALSSANKFGITLIKGSEITRSMPPGHINALFLNDCTPLETDIWQDAVKAASDQGAFLFWNHPGWRQPDEIPVWYDEHTEMFDKGWVKGMEVVNKFSYYPLAHKWCLEKGITMIGNSDVHSPIGMVYNFPEGEHRAMTLVFAREHSPESIHEALLERRTAIYFRDLLIGEEQYLKPLFNNSIKIELPKVELGDLETIHFRVTNTSEVPFKMEARGTLEEVSFPSSFTIPGNRTILLSIRNRNVAEGATRISLPYKVTNLLVAPEEGLEVTLDLDLVFLSREEVTQ